MALFSKKVVNSADVVGSASNENTSAGIVYKVQSVLELPKTKSVHLIPVPNPESESKMIITDLRIESSDIDELAMFIEGAEFVLQLTPVLVNDETTNPAE